MLSSFWFEHECVEDIGEFKFDPAVHAKIEAPKPRAVGDWLRDFEQDNISGLNEFLVSQAYSIRKKLSPGSPITIDMDSTSHVQMGRLMEGLGYNYKDEWCLDSLVAFDQLGLGYNMDLRGGGTFSSEGAPQMIRRIFSGLKRVSHLEKPDLYFRADSAFCNEAVMRACLFEGVKFTLTAHGNTGWEQEARAIPDEQWQPWEYSKEQIESSIKKKRALPRVEVATFLYQPGWTENLRFTIVVKRTWIEYEQAGLFSGQGYWDYYAVLTNISIFKFTPKSIMEHHAQRGNSENFIREAKYNYDLKHFPCLQKAISQSGLWAFGFSCA